MPISTTVCATTVVDGMMSAVVIYDGHGSISVSRDNARLLIRRLLRLLTSPPIDGDFVIQHELGDD